jgi:sulfatase maturation enzyme AslB (radical SAM superfamily)
VNYEIVQFVTDYAKEKSKILNKEVNFSIVSNLTLLTEEKLKRLLDNEIYICCSLDGNEIIHNSNRA